MVVGIIIGVVVTLVIVGVAATEIGKSIWRSTPWGH
jgi:hypothetical protein